MSLTKASFSMITGAVVNVLDYGADPTGATDSSSAIQAALTYAGSITSTKVNHAAVYLPSGAYLASNLEIPLGVILYGDGVNISQIIVTDTVNSCIKMQNYTTVQGIYFSYPNQTTTSTPTAYPPTIINSSVTPASYGTISNVRTEGAYDFISLTGATHFTIQNVDGMPYRYGIVLDTMLDSITIENVHFNYSYTSLGSTLVNWIYNNAIGITFKRVDSAKVTDYLCFGMQNAVSFQGGAPSGSANGIFIENFVFDLCGVPINVVNFQDGLFFSNGWVTSFNTNTTVNYGPCQLGPTGFSYSANQFINFVNVKFNSFYNAALNIACNTSFVNCDFYNYNIGNASDATGAAIVLQASGITIQLSNCYFNGQNYSHSSAVYEGGTYSGYKVQVNNTNIVNSGAGKYDITLAKGRLSIASSEFNSFWQNVLLYTRFNNMYVSAAPTVGTWQVGDIFYNVTPATGQPKGWVCTVAGTPGTWVSTGNL